MGVQTTVNNILFSPPLLSSFTSLDCSKLKRVNHVFKMKNVGNEVVFGVIFDGLLVRRCRTKRERCKVVVSSSGNVGAPLWDTWSPDKASPSPSFSDILWPSLGAFAAMAMFGKMDQTLATRGVSMTIAPLGAVCAVLFITPKSPAARKYNMFLAQIGCGTIGVLAFTLFGPGWLARSAALAASIAFMIATKSTHPPAASLPLLFIDGAKFHGLKFELLVCTIPWSSSMHSYRCHPRDRKLLAAEFQVLIFSRVPSLLWPVLNRHFCPQE